MVLSGVIGVVFLPAHYFLPVLLGACYNSFSCTHRHTQAHTALNHLTLVAMTAAVAAALRCQCVSLTSPAGTPTPGPPCSSFVCMCVMMINTFVLKANREFLCVLCVCAHLCLAVRVCFCCCWVLQYFSRLAPSYSSCHQHDCCL